jgi:hypothetical protein
MRSAPRPVYLNDPECLVVIFDLANPDGPAALDRQRDAIAGYTSVEALDENRVALIVRPGWASEPAA